MKVLIYWHDILLPYSEYLIRAFEDHAEINEIVIAAPPVAASEAIFSAGTKSELPFRKASFKTLETYERRPKWVTLRSFMRAIREIKPDLIIVLDEALSVNVFNAGLANKLERNHAKVLFYGFENLVQGVPWAYLKKNLSIQGLKEFFRKSFRYIFFDLALHPLRRRVVHGGLYCYKECGDIIRDFGWNPAMREQWWGIPLKQYFEPVARTEIGQARTDAGIPADMKVVGFVGRFIKDKGILDLMKALQSLEDVHLILIGAGPLYNTINDKAIELRMQHRIHVLPPKTQQELAVLYRVMDVLALPSHTGWFWKEQYGRVLVEAMACGVPVIGSDSGAIPYVIGDPLCVHEEGNPASIASVIEYVLKSRKPDVETLQAKAGQGDVKVFISAFISIRQALCHI